jgi:alpha-methylacyl-CoA racemase
LTTIFHAMRTTGLWQDEAGTNLLDSGAHFYEVYETSDGGHVAVGALEPQFYAELLAIMELDPAEFPQLDRDKWPTFKQRFAEVFKGRTRAEWAALLEHREACATPVLGLAEAPSHPHNVERKVFVEAGGVTQPAPAPRFSRTPPELNIPPRDAGADTDSALSAWGVSDQELTALRATGAIS